jgi:predicted TIM-barrel fold metal-dependent hydrolase
VAVLPDLQMKRRTFLLGLSAAAVSAVGLAGYRYWPESGLTNPCHSGLPEALRRHPLYHQIWQGLDPAQVWDCHVRMFGNGDSGLPDAPWHSPKMDSLRHPLLRVQKHLFMNGACVDADSGDAASIDRRVVARLSQLCRELPSGFKAMLLAFDWRHDEQGRPQPEQSTLHVPDRYVANLARAESDIFEWIASIHPYRPDAIDALQQARAEGAKAVKWLPQVMNIDPASVKCQRFYQTCADLDLPIITHGGREFALPGSEHTLANPLRLRRALDSGVRVVVAHCATYGRDADLDLGSHGPARPHFELFGRLMDDARYEKLLFGDLSSLTLRNHEWALAPLLQRVDWHPRLINGSDYPLPGVMPFIDCASLQRQGLLDTESVSFLQAIKPYNALLFDFAIKRLLRHGNARFADNVFQTRAFFESR